MTPRHQPLAIAIGLWLLAVAIATPAACADLTILARATASQGLGYDQPGLGLSLWGTHCSAHRLCLRGEVTATTASKADDSAQAAFIGLAELRAPVWRNGWLGAGYQAIRTTGGYLDQTTQRGFLSLGGDWDENHFHARFLLPDDSAYEARGVSVRYVRDVGRVSVAVEAERFGFDVPGGDFERGWRMTALAGRRW